MNQIIYNKNNNPSSLQIIITQIKNIKYYLFYFPPLLFYALFFYLLIYIPTIKIILFRKN